MKGDSVNPLTQGGQADIVRHFQALAMATALPILIYQFPGIVKTSIRLETYEKLAAIPGVVGVKDSQADATEFHDMILALRRPNSPFTSMTTPLHGLNADAIYELRSADGAGTIRAKGSELAQGGLSIEISNKPGSALYIYKKL